MFWGYWTTTGQVRVNMLWYNLQVYSEISTGCLSSNKNCDYKVTDGAIITKVITEAAKLENQLTCCLLTSHTHTRTDPSHMTYLLFLSQADFWDVVYLRLLFSHLCLLSVQVKAWRREKVNIQVFTALSLLVSTSFLLLLPFNRHIIHDRSVSVSVLLCSFKFSSGLGRPPVPPSLWHQAKRLQGFPWSEHREGEMAAFPKGQKGESWSSNTTMEETRIYIDFCFGFFFFCSWVALRRKRRKMERIRREIPSWNTLANLGAPPSLVNTHTQTHFCSRTHSLTGR